MFPHLHTAWNQSGGGGGGGGGGGYMVSDEGSLGSFFFCMSFIHTGWYQY